MTIPYIFSGGNKMEMLTKPVIKFADVTYNLHMPGEPICETYVSNIKVKIPSTRKPSAFTYAPLFSIYAVNRYYGKVLVWGLTSPLLEKNRFYGNYEMALKWANILYADMDIGDDYEVQRMTKITRYKRRGTVKCPNWEEITETRFYYLDPTR